MSHTHRWKLNEGHPTTGRCWCGEKREFSGGVSSETRLSWRAPVLTAEQRKIEASNRKRYSAGALAE